MVRWLWLAAGCSEAGTVSEHVVLRGGRLPGGEAADVELRAGKVVAVGKVDGGAVEVDVTGRFLAPAFVDSHVHLAYLPEADALADHGVAAAVDLAAPLSSLGRPPPAVRWIPSGPMITAVGGYPTQSWGQNGYGLEVTTASEAGAAVDTVHAAGARVVKVPLESYGPSLSDDAIRAAVDRAHALGLLVVTHALTDAAAARAAALGIDGLAHTPTDPLSPATVEAWSGRVVVSTLRAFGGSPTAVDNLRALRAAGATVLYGTDFGNTTDARIDPAELALLEQAGLDGAAILAAGTTEPARIWGLADLGALAPGRAASLLVLDADPHADPSTLSRPEAVWIDGVRR